MVNHHQNTLLSSSDVNCVLFNSCFPLIILRVSFCFHLLFALFHQTLLSSISISVFQLSQLGHFPTHFEDACQQLVHLYIFFVNNLLSSSHFIDKKINAS